MHISQKGYCRDEDGMVDGRAVKARVVLRAERYFEFAQGPSSLTPDGPVLTYGPATRSQLPMLMTVRTNRRRLTPSRRVS